MHQHHCCVWYHKRVFNPRTRRLIMMKKLLLLFALLFAMTAGLSAQTSVYTQNFDSLTAGAAVSGFTNTGTCSWVVGTTTPVSSPNSFGPATASAGNACGEAVYTGGPSLA